MDDRMRAIEQTSPRVAALDGEEAARRLTLRSGAAHLGFVALTAFIALGISAGALPLPTPAALAGVVLLMLVSLVAGVAMSSRPAAPIVCLPAASLTMGVLIGSGYGPLTGAGIPFAAGVVAAELAALVALTLKRPRVAVALSILLPAASTSGLAYVLDGGPVAVSPGALFAGGALATLFALHARLAEAVIPLRHGAEQWMAAAMTRWADGARVLVLRVLQVSAEESYEQEP